MEYLQYPTKGLDDECLQKVLNLVISGIPSIQQFLKSLKKKLYSFKPCYKWNTFNTWHTNTLVLFHNAVLNLVISGIPSILNQLEELQDKGFGFKPCYKWNTFNTLDFDKNTDFMVS